MNATTDCVAMTTVITVENVKSTKQGHLDVLIELQFAGGSKITMVSGR